LALFGLCLTLFGHATSGDLTPFDSRSENVHVFPVVISELELRNIERHIFAAHFVERADYTALEDRPKAFDGLSVNCANDVLARGKSLSRQLYPGH
jgi:hypothetical protein